MAAQDTTISLIDQALISKYSGYSIDTGNPPVSTPITVFLEDPDPEVYKERVYPSVSIRFISSNPEYAGILDSEDLVEASELSYNIGDDTRIMRKPPLPHRIAYSIDTWHKARVSEDRDLMKTLLLYETDPRGYLPIKNIDGEDINAWLFWSGGIISQREKEVDEIIYHNTLTVVVLAYLARVSAVTTTEEKVVKEIDIDVLLRHTWRDQDGFHEDETKDVKDVTLKITDSGVEGSK